MCLLTIMAPLRFIRMWKATRLIIPATRITLRVITTIMVIRGLSIVGLLFTSAIRLFVGLIPFSVSAVSIDSTTLTGSAASTGSTTSITLTGSIASTILGVLMAESTPPGRYGSET